MPSICIHHEACPKCGPIQDGAGDNLGVFDDGHKWCFACGYYVSSSGVVSITDLKARLMARQSGLQGLPVILPADHTYTLPDHALHWLQQYAITNEECSLYRIGWSSASSSLIFPVYDTAGNLLMWQGRWCPVTPPSKGVPHRSRYHTEGNPGAILALFGHLIFPSDTVCVVEDFVSAIKVARAEHSCCLWGSELSLTTLRRLASHYKNLIIWLDNDKALYSARCEVKARPYFEMVGAIYTNRDPKTYSEDEITQWLTRQ